MGRYRLHAALLLLVTGLLGLRGGMAAQGLGDGSPYPPPNTSPAGRPVIASAQPVANSPRAVVRFNDQGTPAAPVFPNAGALQPSQDQSVPPVPRSPGVQPVVPIPDDGLWAHRTLRKLPRASETVSDPSPPEIMIAPTQESEPIVIRPLTPTPLNPRPAIQSVSHTAPAADEYGDPVALAPKTKRIVNTNVASASVWEGEAPAEPRFPARQEPRAPKPRPPKLIHDPNPTPVMERTESVAGVPVLSGAQTAILNLEVAGPGSINRGQPFVYEIVLRNNGSTPAFQVQVEETLQAGVRYLSAAPQPEMHDGRLMWSMGTLAAGAEQRLRLEIQPPADGEVVSSAHATFTTSSSLRTRITQPRSSVGSVSVWEGETPAEAAFPARQEPRPPRLTQCLSVTQTGPETVQIGDEVVVQLQVVNTGSGPATHVLVGDHLPPGLRHPGGAHVEADVGTLAAGESKTLTLRAQAIQTGRQVNEVMVTGDDCAEVRAQGAVTVTQAVLAVRETSPRQARVNEDVEYRLEVASTGSAAATNVRLNDVLPAGLEFVSAGDGGQYAAETRTVSWLLGTLAPGQVRTVTFRARPRLAGEYVHQATAVGERGVEAKAAGAVRTEGVAALTLSVVDLENLVEVNAVTTYEIRVVNQGSGACSNVRIMATVPDGLSVVSVEGANHVVGQQVMFEAVPLLDARAEVVYRVKAKGRKPGDWRFRVQLSGGELTRPVIKEAGTRVVGE